jgi:uncharacterized membrane protein (UPF0127 family)
MRQSVAFKSATFPGLRPSRRRLIAGLVLGLGLAGTPAMAQAPQAGLPTSTVTVVTSDGKQHVFKVEVADTDTTRARGLMYRRQMAADAGMLFDYRFETETAFWMKNTLIPLDMIFIRADGTIANVAQRAVPLDETSIPSNGAVRGVLEVNGGTAARLGIKAGDKVLNPIFGNTN